jgi:HD-GYP domain-containing protein (c-di-GMP phosphodiesterase class II)
MRRVATEHLVVGDRIGRDVLAHLGVLPLLRSGVRVSEPLRRSLQRAGITSVWVDDEISAGIEPPELLSDDTRNRAVSTIRQAFLDSSNHLKTAPSVNPHTLASMSEVVDMMIDDVTSNAHVAIAVNDLANADAYTLKHSLSVAAIGLALGRRVMQQCGWIDATGARRFDSIAARLPALGLGLVLHDIGKLAIPHEILHKPGRLTDAEMTLMKAHPVTGVQMLQRSDISPLARAVVREHHERWNGSGYPDGKAAADIHQFGRIAAVADVFDALTSDRAYRTGEPVSKTWEYIVSRSGIDFDPEIVKVFESSVAPYPVGTAVMLSDGSKAIVTDVREGIVGTPKVRVLLDGSGAAVTPTEIDLAKTPEMKILSTCERDPFDVLKPKAL